MTNVGKAKTQQPGEKMMAKRDDETDERTKTLLRREKGDNKALQIKSDEKQELNGMKKETGDVRRPCNIMGVRGKILTCHGCG